MIGNKIIHIFIRVLLIIGGFEFLLLVTYEFITKKLKSMQ